VRETGRGNRVAVLSRDKTDVVHSALPLDSSASDTALVLT